MRLTTHHQWFITAALSRYLIVVLCFFFFSTHAFGRSLSVNFKFGEEFDTNAQRVVDGKGSDFVTRLFLKIAGVARTRSRGGLSLNLRSGGKIFAGYDSENTYLNQLDVRYTTPPISSLKIHLAGKLKDRSEKVHHLDYFIGAASAGLLVTRSKFQIGGGGGYNFFVFKADDRLFNYGPSLNTHLTWSPEEELVVILNGAINWQDYKIPIVDPETNTILDTERADRLLNFGATFRFYGPFYVEAGYNLRLNRSNSGRYNYDRHSFRAILTIPILVDLILGIRFNLQLTNHDELFNPALGIDEESRNGVEVSLSYQIIESMGVEIKFNAYNQQFRDGRNYERKVIYLGVYFDTK